MHESDWTVSGSQFAFLSMRVWKGRTILGMEPGERRTVLLLAGSILTTIASYTLVKAVRDAVFLARFGSTELALLFVMLAGTAGVFSAIGSRFAHVSKPHWALAGTHFVVAASLVLLWLPLRRGMPGMAWVLYIWSSFFGLFLLANFWLLGNRLYDVRTAKRVFPLLGAGAILGGVVGGQTAALAATIGTVNLLLIVAGGFVLSAVLAVMAWYCRAPAEAATRPLAAAEPKPSIAEGYRAVRNHQHLQLIAGLVLLATVGATLVDLQLKTAAKEYFGSSRDAMTAFFGALTKILSAFSLAIQLLVTSRFLRRFGVVRALLVLPVVLASGAILIALHPILGIPAVAAVAVTKIGESGLRFSLDKAALELLYLPVAPQIKTRAKPIIDTLADRSGTAVTGLLWLALTFASRAHARELVILASAMTVAVIAGTVMLIVRIRPSYVAAFRASLRHDRVSTSARARPRVKIEISDRQQREVVFAALRSGNEGTVLRALELIERSGPLAKLGELTMLLEHPSARVRARAFDVSPARRPQAMTLALDLLSRTSQSQTPKPKPKPTPSLRFPATTNGHLREAAVGYLARSSPAAVEELIVDPAVPIPARLAALSFLARFAPSRARRIVESQSAAPTLEDLRDAVRGQDRRADAAVVLRVYARADALPMLVDLVHDGDPRVSAPAAASCAWLGDTTQVRRLLATLACQPRRRATTAALKGFGPVAISDLTDGALDAALPCATRLMVPSLLAATGAQAAVDALCRLLRGVVPGLLRTRIVRALWRIRGLRLDSEVLHSCLLEEIDAYRYRLAAIEQERRTGSGLGPNRGARLLCRLLAERLDEDLARTFSLLALRYPEREILAAYHGLRRGDAARRASAIELLDNLLENPLKGALLAVLEPHGDPGMIPSDFSTKACPHLLSSVSSARSASSPGRANPDTSAASTTPKRPEQRVAGSKRRRPEQARLATLSRLYSGEDPILRAFVLFAIGESRLVELRHLLAAATSDNETIVREAAQLALASLAQSSSSTGGIFAMTQVEKVLLLQRASLLAHLTTDALVEIA
ncbi:MAG: Npt1/Npt2 family nucleotide transporter, partial [Pseudomonadota bacterium]